MLHGHCLVRLEETLENPLTAEWVDNMISAMLPDEPEPGDHSLAANQQRKERAIICRNNLHDCNGGFPFTRDLLT